MAKLFWVLILSIVVLTGCALTGDSPASKTPTLAPESKASAPQPETALMSRSTSSGVQDVQLVAFNNTACMHPAGWQTYRVSEFDVAASLAAQRGITVEQMLKGNCLFEQAELVPGLLIYLPPLASPSTQTILPLGISAFRVEPAYAAPGESVTLYWDAQGAVQQVRVGMVFENQFDEQQTNLPEDGMLQITAPDDGRRFVTYSLMVSDGYQEVAAQTTLQLSCRENWFFTPSPMDCPSSLLVTEYVEQNFERGTIVYMPALGQHTILVTGQEAITVADTFVPGMKQGFFDVPAGYQAIEGAIFSAWVQASDLLGYAVSPPTTYTGLMQRSVSPAGEQIYISAASGHVYRLGRGLVWGVIIPQ